MPNNLDSFHIFAQQKAMAGQKIMIKLPLQLYLEKFI